MNDLISRQAAIDAIEELISARLDWKSDSSGERQGLNAAMCVIEDLPSAEPEQKIAKWESISDVIWYCSECKYAHSRSNYCPHCGAKMIKENS